MLEASAISTLAKCLDIIPETIWSIWTVNSFENWAVYNVDGYLNYGAANVAYTFPEKSWVFSI